MSKAIAIRQTRAISAPGQFVVQLASVGNPDYRQFAPISEPETFIGDSLQACQQACRRYIVENELGGGNWAMPWITRDGVRVARVSFNGRVWGTDGKEVVL